MSTPQDNVARLREAYQAWSDTLGKSAEHWIALMDEDVLLHSLGDEASGIDFSNGLRGKHHARQYFDGLDAEWEMIHYTVHEFIADGDRVAMLGRCAFRNRRTGKPVESTKMDFYRFRDGLIVEYHELFDTARVLAAATPD